MMTLSNTDILFTAFDALMQADTVYNNLKTISTKKINKKR